MQLRWTLPLAILLASTGCMSMFAKKSPEPPVTDFSGQALPGASISGEGAATNDLPGSSLEAQNKPTGLAKLKPSNVWNSTKNAMGLGPDQGLARRSFKEGEELFGRAQSKADYAAAAKKFKVAAERWPDSGLEEDALYWQAESYFFSDQYPKAEETYDALIKKYANSKHLDRVIIRQFAIAEYWYKYNEADPSWPITPNFFDKTRPLFDTRGHGMSAFEHVRLNDPRGQLADDAIMATGNAHFLKQRYEDADYYYSLIRKDYSRSEHLKQSYLLGLQCKLLMYQGSGYDGTPLDQADELVDQMLIQFPRELADERDRLLTIKKELAAQKAKRDFDLAQYYDNGDHYGAARYYYRQIVQQYPHSSFAEQSRARLAEITSEPDNPPSRLAWLDTIFDEDHRQDMLRKNKTKDASGNPSTVVR